MLTAAGGVVAQAVDDAAVTAVVCDGSVDGFAAASAGVMGPLLDSTGAAEIRLQVDELRKTMLCSDSLMFDLGEIAYSSISQIR